MKQCARCKQWKEESEFNWRWKDLGRLQSVCRDCQSDQSKESYGRHGEEVREKAALIKQKAIEEAQRFMYEFLSNSICADCKEYDFSVLTFDHVRGIKKMDVSAMVSQGYSINAIKDELSKCEVVCASCHMRRESKRKSGGRFRKYWPE